MYNTSFHSPSAKDAAPKSLQSHSTCSIPGLAESKFLPSVLKKAKSKDDLQLEQSSIISPICLESKLSSRVSLSACQTSPSQEPSLTASLDMERLVSSTGTVNNESAFLPPSEVIPFTPSPTTTIDKSICALCPPEILVQIFSFLSSPVDLATCSMVSRYWYRVASRLIWSRPLLFSLTSLQKLANLFKSGKVPRHCLVKEFNLTNLDETHRNNQMLSFHLSRMMSRVGPSLLELDLGFCKGLKNYDLMCFIPYLSNLTSLNLAGGNRSDIVLTKLVKHCPSLVRLSLSWNSHLTDFGFIELARQCPQMQYLDLTNCAQISDNAVTAISSYCRKLRALSLSYCENVTVESLWNILNRCNVLLVLNTYGCPSVSRSFLDDGPRNFPMVEFNIPGLLPFYFRPSRKQIRG
ncbi:SCF ubiquitin ligase complex subunit [Entomophthora muscae]|uniref:SCF ubiquitin ligase complex subunit n=1 Tax=Entomophthora muscae TaxID=34485 RepID=A0ACC2U2G9_9FUNG|nr:SCF ubiquitin ligase complex subunit [Entomophthora muscae]